MTIYSALRKVLFAFDPEMIHGITIRLLNIFGRFPQIKQSAAHSQIPSTGTTEVCGLKFSNKIGLAAGYDKNGLGWKGLAKMGFGHIEIGTVTPKPQKGNKKPRIFRLVKDQAIINRMGFPSKGADYVFKKLQGKKPDNLILGINIGKNKDTELEKAYKDYLFLIDKFSYFADYFAINISSPNTVGLRKLQSKEFLGQLLEKCVDERDKQVKKTGRKIPLFVKLAPDLTKEELVDSLDIILEKGIDGIIATNTTITRNGLITKTGESGGLSGFPLREQSTKIIKFIHDYTNGKLPIIGMGGIMTIEDAAEKIKAGASLVQIFTGLIYNGPSLISDCIKELS